MTNPNIITREERLARKGCTSCGKPVSAQPATKLPSNWQMFKNLIGAAAEAAKNGFDVRNGGEVETVLKICEPCEKLVHDERGLRCGVCGCFLGGPGNLGKVTLKAWHCPLGKW